MVLTDLSRALREEERAAWQRLLRVLAHELNNSLAPIKSIAGTMTGLLKRQPRMEDWEQDMQRGLEVISSRTEALHRFVGAYTQLARLPQPRLAQVDVGAWVRRVVGLETGLRVAVEPGPPLAIAADGDLLDQLLINLVRNAVDASLETAGRVTVRGAGTAPDSKFGSRTRARACPTRPICSCRFSPPKRPVPASAWSSAAKSPRPTAVPSCWKTEPTTRAVAPGYACRWNSTVRGPARGGGQSRAGKAEDPARTFHRQLPTSTE